jgi:hypothetical protein
VAGGGTEIVVAVVSMMGGMLLEWMRARGARSVTSLQLEDSRERRLQEASDALIDDYRRRLADALAELDREMRMRRALERKHFHQRSARRLR